MLFRRRDEPGHWERIRVALWPRRTWARSARYMVKRALRLSATPHAIAAGIAAGAFASITPFVGLHFMLGALLAYVTGGNLIASAFGTALGNPLTFPFIWAGTYRVGLFILGLGDRSEPPIDMSAGVFQHSLDSLLPAIKPMLVGAIPLGIVTWIASYLVVRSVVTTYQEGRRKRLSRTGSGRTGFETGNPGK